MKLPKNLNIIRTSNMIPDLSKESEQNTSSKRPLKQLRNNSRSNLRVLWTSTEVQVLLKIVESTRPRKWNQIAIDLNSQVHSSLPVRNAKNCRYRWLKQTKLRTQEFQSVKMEGIKSKKVNIKNSIQSENFYTVKKHKKLETSDQNSSFNIISRNLCLNDKDLKTFDESHSVKLEENQIIRNIPSQCEGNKAEVKLRLSGKNYDLGKVVENQSINANYCLGFEEIKYKFHSCCVGEKVNISQYNFESEENSHNQEELKRDSIGKNISISDKKQGEIEHNSTDSELISLFWLDQNFNLNPIDEKQENFHSLEYDPDLHLNTGVELSKCTNNYDLNIEYLGQNIPNIENISQLWTNNPAFQSWFPFNDNIEVDINDSFELYSKDWESTRSRDSYTEDWEL